MGGSIGYGTPVATGAAVACPDRRVIALEGDGSAMYTIQSLWTQARENLNITTVIFANRTYEILKGEFTNVDAGKPGQKAVDMLNLDRPTIDWISLAKSMGVPGVSVANAEDFYKALDNANRTAGPSLVEVQM
jgi:acetolactate synthase-1/2/3 large subunit